MAHNKLKISKSLSYSQSSGKLFNYLLIISRQAEITRFMRKTYYIENKKKTSREKHLDEIDYARERKY